MRFANKAAIITGGAQGIGRAVALRLAREGAFVIVVDRAREGCESVQAEIESFGQKAGAICTDLQTADGAREMVSRALEMTDRIDVSVHNVGGTIWMKPFWEYADDEIEQEVARSLWPTIWSCRAVIPQMLKQNSGAIVNVGSFASRGIYRVPYSASKGGVHALTSSLALELAPHGIRINCVAPGGVDVGPRATPRNPMPLSAQEQTWKAEVTAQTLSSTPLKRYGTPDEQASAICYLAADESSYITGQTVFVAGGGVG
ncbi:3-oxoacyl-[acyl-carrier-protein] reductase FabG [Pigmentiphaga humi]|uniref:3-oxoacyl-[acyl-carrier-protein] reductase FabG n=1 Tax=Pigmentiphaga humi TaxID=2478468 RepID=A0A3P4AXU9_9BURK|nr:1,6-dihydroxycyclohexa-2,4-diene-1-carboxylate dehydrogenase [Pigmentiphaga humi]VCU68899.1 3-oxoacyl-[acyl-carrier-protein] reductase FabG [Pigmentiphaga humi]